MMNTANSYRRPTFSIIDRSTGKTLDSIKACYIKVIEIDRYNLPTQILGTDGYVYTAVYDMQIPKEARHFRAIVSFQQHTYGNFAVLRMERR